MNERRLYYGIPDVPNYDSYIDVFINNTTGSLWESSRKINSLLTRIRIWIRRTMSRLFEHRVQNAIITGINQGGTYSHQTLVRNLPYLGKDLTSI